MAISFNISAPTNNHNNDTAGITVLVPKLCTIINIPKANKIIPTNKFVRYSILPKPKGWYLVGFFLEILAPIIHNISVTKSQNVWSPSANNELSPNINPPIILAIEITKLLIMLYINIKISNFI